jgi:hypothetical protein
MSSKPPLTWEEFITMARVSGLDINDPHMEELYAYLLTVLPGLKAVQELDLRGVIPAMVYVPPQE